MSRYLIQLFLTFVQKASQGFSRDVQLLAMNVVVGYV